MKYALTQHKSEPETLKAIAALKKRNAWGNALALKLISEYVSRPIVVWTQGGIAWFGNTLTSGKLPLFLALSRCHYETIHPSLGVKIIKATDPHACSGIEGINFLLGPENSFNTTASRAPKTPYSSSEKREIKKWINNIQHQDPITQWKPVHARNEKLLPKLRTYADGDDSFSSRCKSHGHTTRWMLKRGKSFLQSVVQIGTPFTFVGVLALLRLIALSEATAVGDSGHNNVSMAGFGATPAADTWTYEAPRCRRRQVLVGSYGCRLPPCCLDEVERWGNSHKHYWEALEPPGELCANQSSVGFYPTCTAKTPTAKAPTTNLKSNPQNDTLCCGIQHACCNNPGGKSDMVRWSTQADTRRRWDEWRVCSASGCIGKRVLNATFSLAVADQACDAFQGGFARLSTGLYTPMLLWTFLHRGLRRMFPKLLSFVEGPINAMARNEDELVQMERELIRLRENLHSNTADTDPAYQAVTLTAYDNLERRIEAAREYLGTSLGDDAIKLEPLRRRTKREINQASKADKKARVDEQEIAQPMEACNPEPDDPSCPESMPGPSGPASVHAIGSLQPVTPPKDASPIKAVLLPVPPVPPRVSSGRPLVTPPTPPAGPRTTPLRPIPAISMPASRESMQLGDRPTMISAKGSPKGGGPPRAKALVPSPPSYPPPGYVGSTSQEALATGPIVRICSYGQQPDVEPEALPQSEAYDQVLTINMRGFYDPQAQRHLRGHLGTHTETLRAILHHEDGASVAAIASFLTKLCQKTLVKVFCTQGKHRSVAMAEILGVVLRKAAPPNADITVQHLNSNNWGSTCYSRGSCFQCALLNSGAVGDRMLQEEIVSRISSTDVPNPAEHRLINVARAYMVRAACLACSWSVKLSPTRDALTSPCQDCVVCSPGTWQYFERQDKCNPILGSKDALEHPHPYLMHNRIFVASGFEFLGGFDGYCCLKPGGQAAEVVSCLRQKPDCKGFALNLGAKCSNVVFASARLKILRLIVVLLFGGHADGDNPQSFDDCMDFWSDLSPISQHHEPSETEDFFLNELVVTDSSCHAAQVTQSQLAGSTGASCVVEQRSLVGAQPASVTATLIDTLSTKMYEKSSYDSDPTRAWTQYPLESLLDSPPSKRRKIEVSLAESQHNLGLSSNNHCEQLESTSSLPESYVGSLLDFLKLHGPYPGWEYEEYAMPCLPLYCAETPYSYTSSSNTSMPEHSSNSRVSSIRREDFGFWDQWSQDSDGHVRQRVQSPLEPIASFDTTSDLWEQVPQADLERWFRDDTLEISSEPSSHPSLNDVILQSEPDTTEYHQILSGGGKQGSATESPTDADISKQIQRIKDLSHGLASKQLRMMFKADVKFYRKIQRTQNEDHLNTCILAEAKRMGLKTTALPPTNVTQTEIAKAKGKGTGALAQGKGANTTSAPKLCETAVTPSPACKGKSNGKGKDDTQNSKSKGKGKKGLGSHTEQTQDNPEYEIVPDGWNVLPAVEFNGTQGGIFAMEKEDDAKRLAEAAAHMPFPVGILSPRPIDIGIGAPRPLLVEFFECRLGQKHVVTLHTYLHQLTAHEVKYAKNARAVQLTKPTVARTQVVYVKFTDQGASAQTRLELQDKKPYHAKAWIQSLITGTPVQLHDAWNMQETSVDNGVRHYSISVRIPSEQVPSILAISLPGKIQTNIPAHVRTELSHVWLKDQDGSMNDEKVKQIVAACPVPHLGCFQIRGTWALRVKSENLKELKSYLGRDNAPAYFVQGCSADMDAQDLREMAKQINWAVTAQDNDCRWRRGGPVWLVRAEVAPPVHSFPLNYGYERLQIKIVPAAKPPRPMMPQHTSQFQIPTYTSWKSQFRNYKAPVDASKRPSFKDVLQQNGPPNKKSKVQVSQQNIGLTSMAVQPAAVMNSASSAEQSLQYQLANLQQQNAEQQAQITKLLDQIAQLTQQLQQFTHHSQQVPVPPDAEMNGGGL